MPPDNPCEPMARGAEKNIRMFAARLDEINAEHLARVRAHKRQWFWTRVMLVLIGASAVVITLWRTS